VGQYAFREALPAKTKNLMAALWRNLVNLSDEIEVATKSYSKDESDCEPEEAKSRRSKSKISSKSKTIKKLK
jgi:hypothetical protein